MNLRSSFIAVSLILASASFAQYAPNRLAIVRVGAPFETPSALGNSVHLDLAGKVVGETPVPDVLSFSTSDGFVLSGLDGTEGGISRSPNGVLGTLAGYRNLAASGTLGSSSSSTVNRVLMGVGFDGSFTRNILSNAFDSGSIRGGTNDGVGSHFGAGATLAGLAGTGGIQRSLFGAGTSSGIYTTNYDLRRTRIYNGKLYGSTNVSLGAGVGIYEFANVPTGAATPTRIINVGHAFDFVVASPTVIYVAHGGTATTNTATSRGIQKWVFSGGSWQFAYVIRDGFNAGETAVGLEYDGAALYCITGNSNGVVGQNRIVAVYDNGDTDTDGVGDATVTQIVSGILPSIKLTGIMMIPEPAFAGSEYAATITSNMMAFRTFRDGERKLIVGRNRIGTPKNWTQIASFSYGGHIQDFIANDSGVSFALEVQPSTDFAGYRYRIRKIALNGSVTNSAFFTAPAGFEPWAFAQTNIGRLAVLLVDGEDAQIQYIEPNLTLGLNANNGGSSFSQSGYTPVNIAGRGASAAILFSDDSSVAMRSVNPTTGASTLFGPLSIPQEDGVSLNPFDVKFDATNKAYLLNVGVGGNINLFRLDTSAGSTGALMPGYGFRRDAVGVNGNSSPDYWQRAVGVSLKGTTPMVNMLGLFGGDATLSSPTDLQQIPGSGKVWELGGASYSYTSANFRFMPGYAPVN